MGQWTSTMQPGKCVDSGWHRRPVFVLHLAWSGQRAFVTERMPSKTRKYQRLWYVSGTANDSLSGWTYCSHENNQNSFKESTCDNFPQWQCHLPTWDLPSVLQNKKTKSKLLNMAIKTDWSCPSKIGPCPALQPLLSLFPAIIIYDTATSNFLLFPTHIHTIFQPKVLLTLLPLTGMPSSQLTSDTAIISLTTLCGLLLHPFKMKLNNNCLDPSHLTVKH